METDDEHVSFSLDVNKRKRWAGNPRSETGGSWEMHCPNTGDHFDCSRQGKGVSSRGSNE